MKKLYSLTIYLKIIYTVEFELQEYINCTNEIQSFTSQMINDYIVSISYESGRIGVTSQYQCKTNVLIACTDSIQQTINMFSGALVENSFPCFCNNYKKGYCVK